MLHKIYNLENVDRQRYKYKVEEFFFKNNGDEEEDVIRLLTNELERLSQLFLKDTNDCAQVYMTSKMISMIFWIKTGYPVEKNFKAILPMLLKAAKFTDNKVKNCIWNSGLYQTYYSTMYPNDLQNASPWLSSFGYMFQAPEDIRDFVLQTNYIGSYRFAKDYFNWCSIYSELEKHMSEIHYTDFFREHKPCK